MKTLEEVILDVMAVNLGRSIEEVCAMATEKYVDQYTKENERLKTELAEIKRFLQELYHSGNKVVPELWRVMMERFVK